MELVLMVMAQQEEDMVLVEEPPKGVGIDFLFVGVAGSDESGL